MLRPNKRIEEIIQAANERNRRKFPNRAGRSALPKTMGGFGDAYNRRRGTGRVIEQYGSGGSRGGRRGGQAQPSRGSSGGGRRRMGMLEPPTNRRGGRVGTGLAGSRRRTSSSRGRRGRRSFAGGRGGRIGTSSGPASRLSDRQRQQMKDRFAKATAESYARRRDIPAYYRPGGRGANWKRPVKGPSSARRRSLLSGSRRNRYRRRR